jgi:hypothetical protein
MPRESEVVIDSDDYLIRWWRDVALSAGIMSPEAWKRKNELIVSKKAKGVAFVAANAGGADRKD